MPYSMYVRKSRADAEAELRGEGETLSRHISILTALAQKRGMQIGAIHKEIVSGETIAARPEMQMLLSEVEQGMWEGVLVVEVERLARGDTIDQGIVAQTFKYSNTKIITPIKDYDPSNEFDEEYFEFGLFMSRREYKTIRRRLEQGRIASVKDGRYVGSVAPYGYDRARTDKNECTLKINESEAEIVRLIYNLYVYGEKRTDGTSERIGVAKIVRRLNNSDYRPRKSKDWSVASIQGILNNPVYMGKIRWNNRKTIKKVVNGTVTEERPRAKQEDLLIVDGLHEPIIDEKTYNLAQYYMKQNPPKPIGERNKMTNVLSGLVVCDMCGHKMVRRPYPNREPSLICANTNCGCVSTDLSSVERKILQSLQGWLLRYKLTWQEDEPSRAEKISSERTLKRLKTEHDKLKSQLNNAYDLVEQGIYSADVFIERSNALKAKIEQNETETNKIEYELKEEQKRDEQKRNIIPKVENLLEVYDTIESVEAKNALLKEVIEKVVYRKDKGGRWGDPEDYEIIVYPKLPENQF